MVAAPDSNVALLAFCGNDDDELLAMVEMKEELKTGDGDPTSDHDEAEHLKELQWKGIWVMMEKYILYG